MGETAELTERDVFVHPRALCESEQVGAGTRVWAFAHVMKGAVIGRDCNVCGHAFIESGVRIGSGVTIKNQVMVWEGVVIEDDVFVGPGVIFTNDRRPRSSRMAEAMERYSNPENWLLPTTVRRGASIGAGAIIVCGNTIGEYAMVGAGAVVTADVPKHHLVVGNPATTAGLVCTCGGRLDERLVCRECSCVAVGVELQSYTSR